MCDGNTLTVVLDTETNGNRYRCVLHGTNFTEELFSDEVTVSLAPKPLTFVTQPQSYVGEPGDQVTFTAEATGYDPAYSWYWYYAEGDEWFHCHNGNTFTVTLSMDTQGSRYRCVATDFEGNQVISDEVTMTLVPNPLTVVTQPRGYVGEPGDEVTFTVAATGYGVSYRWEIWESDSYEWYWNSMDYGDQFTVTLNYNTHGNRYRCVVTDIDGNEVASDEVTITVVES